MKVKRQKYKINYTEQLRNQHGDETDDPKNTKQGGGE